MMAKTSTITAAAAIEKWQAQIFGLTISAFDILLFFTLYVFILIVFRLTPRGQSRRRSVCAEGPGLTGRSLPGPWNYPIVGYLPKLGNRPFVTMWNLSRKYGDVYQIRMGSHEVLVLNGIEMLKEAFLRQGKIFSGRPNFASFQALSNGKSITFESYSPSWRIHNKLAVRAMSSLVTSKSRPIDGLITRNALRLVEQLTQRSGTALDAYELIEDSILRVVHGLCFGDAAVTDEFCEAIKRELAQMRASMPVIMPADMLPWLQRLVRPELKRFEKTVTRYKSLIDEMSNRVRKTISDGEQPRCIVNSLMNDWENLVAADPDATAKSIEKEKVLATIHDLIGAGSEGVVNFIYWAIRYVISYPDVQERLRTEVHNTIGLDALPVDRDRASMPFVESFIWEVIRHSTMSPLTIPHATLQDTLLAGYFVPKGMVVIGNMYSTSHDPRIWSDPELFRPDRFLDPDTGLVNRSKLDQFLCFGLGRRRCLGEVLGRMEMFLFLVVILQRCRFSRVDGDDLKMEGEMTLVYRDNVEWDEEQEKEARTKVEENSKNRLPPDAQEKYETHSGHYWNEFYAQHQNRFFKDRHWLFTEFPELAPLYEEKTTGDAADVRPTEEKQDVGFPGEHAAYRIFEVGCGVGNTVFPILQTSNDPNLFVYCCDLSDNAIQLVKENSDYNERRCHAFVGDVSDPSVAFSFPAESVDIIVLIFVLSAINPEKMSATIQRLSKLLKPGGLIVFRDYGRYDLTQLRFKPGRCLADNFYVRGDGTKVYYFTQEELRTLFTDAGLIEEQNLIDRRLQVNRCRQLKMYRVWIQCKYRKPKGQSSSLGES